MEAKMKQKILLVQVAALGYNFLKRYIDTNSFFGLEIKPIKSVFPALTSTVQATMRTAALPAKHGIVANGFFFKDLHKPLFWEQNSGLVEGRRIWDKFRKNGGQVAQMFIQQSLGPDSDIYFSPAPVHKHHGGMIIDCISKPVSLNARLKKELGPFPLSSYWGPLASKISSEWIADSAISVMNNEKPDLLYVYLPHLDYDLQRFGPVSQQGWRAFWELLAIIKKLSESASKSGYKKLFFSDYAITPANEVIYPNQTLMNNGFFKTRNVNGMLYPDFHSSAAFSVVDHQIAHVYVFDLDKTGEAFTALQKMEGIYKILDIGGKTEAGVDHIRSGDFILIAKKGFWFDYRWWNEKAQAPDYATHVDIHNKPGYDPCELFFGWPPGSISQDPRKIKGSHGRVDDNEPVFYSSDLDIPGNTDTILRLAENLEKLLV
jgi:predicted AlkP superfamily pyrophosphatase or phosphodiesterase